MINRYLEKELRESLNYFPVVAIMGTRQVGKTTLAKIVTGAVTKKTIYLDLELISDWNKLKDPEMFLTQYSDYLVIIDEVQRKPELFPLMRALVDQNRVPARFLILGSAAPSLKNQSNESLAGRVNYLNLRPLNYREISAENNEEKLKKLIYRGGYPSSYLAETDEISYKWRQSMISTYLEKDVSQFGNVVSLDTLQTFWKMVAGNQGQIWNASKIAASMGVSSPTITKWIQMFMDVMLVKKLYPYYTNIKKRLIKSPKMYIVDSGLYAGLMVISNWESLISFPNAGSLFEGFVIQEIISYMPDTWQIYYYRTRTGAEIDVLLVTPRLELIAIEIKFSKTAMVTKGYMESISDLEPRKNYIVYFGDEKYAIKKNIFALPVYNIPEIFGNI